MTTILPTFIRQSALDPRFSIDGLTHVELVFRPGKIEHWLRFGAPIKRTGIDKKRSVASFNPHQTFAFMRWASNDHGTVISRLDIVRTVGPLEAYQTLPFVRPGGEILLRIDNWEKIERVNQLMDTLELSGISLTDVSADYWRHVHNRLSVNQEPHLYTKIQHKAWLMRTKVQP